MKKKTKTAVILAGGRGKRLDAFETPKPLLKVGGRPLIVHTLDLLLEAGIKDIHIVTNKGSSVLQKELFDYPANISFIEGAPGERGMLDSILALKGKIEGPFFVSVCDLVFSQNPYKIYFKQIKDTDAVSVLIGTDQKSYEASGANVKVQYDGKQIQDIGERLEDHNARDIGIYHFTKSGFNTLHTIATADKNIKTVAQLLGTHNRKKKVTPIIYSKSEWFDINIPNTLVRAELYLGEAKNKKEKKNSDVPKVLLKKLTRTTALHNTKSTVTDIIVKQNILGNLSEYEVIPTESYKSPHHLLVDKNIDKAFGEHVFRQLTLLGYRVYKYVVEPGENAKGITEYVDLAGRIIQNGLDKKSTVISLGGGATKDMAGFLASTLYRGIGFISIPTTVLSMADAAIALKQGVNGTNGKNLIGSWYAPLKIIVDPAVLKTLPDRYISDGLAECIKQSLAYDKKFYNMLKNYEGDIRNIDFLEKVIKKAITLKVVSIEQDLSEDRIALVNQYGHEFGHAIEHLSGYAYGHGESVAIGMRVSVELSHILGITSQKVVDAHIELLKKYNLPYRVPKNISPEDIIYSLRYNKKYYSGEPRFVLVKSIGSVWRDRRYYTVNCKDEFLKEAISKSYD